MTIALVAMVWTAMEKRRRAHFNRFYLTHHLFLVFVRVLGSPAHGALTDGVTTAVRRVAAAWHVLHDSTCVQRSLSSHTCRLTGALAADRPPFCSYKQIGSFWKFWCAQLQLVSRPPTEMLHQARRWRRIHLRAYHARGALSPPHLHQQSHPAPLKGRRSTDQEGEDRSESSSTATALQS